MAKTQPRIVIPADRLVQDVPKDDMERLKHAMQEKVIKPMQARARMQRSLIAKVRGRSVR